MNKNQVIIEPKDIINQARTWLGTKYHHQGRLKKSNLGLGGVDCIGLLVGVIKELGIQDGKGNSLVEFDETNYSIYPENGRLLKSIKQHLDEFKKEEMQMGDIMLFKTFRDPQHVGLLAKFQSGGFSLIHCNSSAGKVVEQPFLKTWEHMLTNVYRFRNEQLKSIKS